MYLLVVFHLPYCQVFSCLAEKKYFLFSRMNIFNNKLLFVLHLTTAYPSIDQHTDVLPLQDVVSNIILIKNCQSMMLNLMRINDINEMSMYQSPMLILILSITQTKSNNSDNVNPI